ncbi:MAG: isoleucine--tRNA ligase [Bdellovibrionales bacterium]
MANDSDAAARYKETVALPVTDFPMKANLSQTEPARISQWLKDCIYDKMLAKNKGKKKFVMPDGPPYANGNIHVGHVLNKVLKDIITKYRNMAGYSAPFIPGWDCHGLPIELNVTKALGPKRATTSDTEVRKLCRDEALNWVAKQRDQFQRLGVFADWPHPYLTLDPAYEAEEVRVLAQILDNGILYRGEKPVNWDPALQTALAAAEVEYKTHKSPSIYVKFDLDADALKKLGLKSPAAVVIWTTTPWTLPANYGVSLNPHFDYGAFETSAGTIIVAEALAESVAKACALELKKVKSFKGSDFDRLKARHPFLPRESVLVLGEHVTLEAGTGCVHTAPAHGMDDYIVGSKYGLPVKSPVDAAGKFSNEMPDMVGLSVWDGNKVVIEKLKVSGHLLSVTELEHQYPYGPRSKKPLIFRATPQWFIRMDDPKFNLRQKAMNAIEKQIEFVPGWGVQRLTGMMSNSPDWCLSRQRVWGVPIPVFYCSKCDQPLVKSSIMRKVADKMEQTQKGIEAYHDTPENEFTAGEKCEKCGGHEFKRGRDILDVWFDSGVCHTAVQRRRPELAFPADIYIEGSDQHRGWFQTSLTSSLAATGEPPFKTLITHGFVNDAQGFKMSKSQGNVVDPAEVMKDSGAEILRMWVAYENFGDDLTISKEMLTRISDTYRRFRNTIRFLLGNLGDFDPSKDRVPVAQMPELDRWALNQFAELIQKCRDGYDKYEFYKVYHSLNNFFTVELSATYLDILKDRLYTGRRDGLPRRSSQTVIYELTKGLCGLLAPVASFLAEETYQYLPGPKNESVFLTDFPEAPKEWRDPQLAGRFAKILEVRAEVSKILEDLRRQKVIGAGLDAKIQITAEGETLAALEGYQGRLSELFIVSQLSLSRGAPLRVEAQAAEGEKCVRCWHYDTKTGTNAKWPGLCPKCVEALS